ncbi:MAG: NAD(+)/NADH kinase [Duncaniella sp.]|nr:NAD(+)/NADH kinase [Duncaniella sp.]
MIRIAVFGKRRQSEADVEGIEALFSAMEKAGAFIMVQRQFFEAMSQLTGRPLAADDVFDGSDFNADLAVSIGGDGTFLRTARWVGAKETPIVGFNTGHLGFLAEESLVHASAVIADIIEGKTFVERRSLLEVHAIGPNVRAAIQGWAYALNEVAILRQDTASMISVHARLDDTPVACYQGDGLIISTPTGSTAYNLSVGGPIVQPTAPCWVLSPVAAHAMTMRPLVVSDSHVIEISVESRSDTYRLDLDGRSLTLDTSTGVRITRAPFTVNVLHVEGYTFTDTLRSKLLWGVSRR